MGINAMNIIHFDIGANMAFAHNGCGDFVVVEKFVCEGSRAWRAACTLLWLARRHSEFKKAGIKFDVCHYERPFTRGYDASRSLWGIAGLIEGVFGNDCVVLDSTPQQIKTFAIGEPKRVIEYEIVKGKKKRKKMTSAARTKAAAEEKLLMIARAQALGYMGENEHEADAFLGLKYAEQNCVATTGEKK